MTKEEKLALLKARASRIEARGKFLKAPGALNKVKRKIAALEK